MTITEENKPLQMRFELHLPTGRPLAPLKAVMVVLDRSEDDVKYLCESGMLEYAFDLRGVDAQGEPAERADLRIYRGSIIRYLHKDFGKSEDSLAGVLRACLPPGRKPLRVAELVRLWSSSSTHLHNLLAADLFKAVPGQKLKPKESPLLERESVVEFLKERRIA